MVAKNSVARNSAGKDKSELYHATLLVTRAEEWCVEASSQEDARARLQRGEGHRCSPGEIFAVELGDIL